MESSISATPRQTAAAYELPVEAASSGVSWGAVLGGASVGAALALILLLLGTGLGMAVTSPWANDGASAKTVGVAAIVWLIFVHLASSAVGGYIAGRLRTRWVDVQTDEVFFRDTANGLISWAVGIVITAAFLTSAVASIVGGVTKAGGVMAATAGAGLAAGAGAQAKSESADANVYTVDAMFRSDRAREEDDSAVREEVGRVVAHGLRQGEFPAADKTYLSQVVAAKTGLPQPEAEKRVSDALAQAQAAELKARQTADAARKAAAHLSMWTFLALLIGAFTASYAATIGGRQRDAGSVIRTGPR